MMTYRSDRYRPERLDLCTKGAPLRVDLPGHLLHGKRVTATDGGKRLASGEVIGVRDRLGAEFKLPVTAVWGDDSVENDVDKITIAHDDERAPEAAER